MSHPMRHHTRRDTGSNREMPPNHTTSARTHDNHEHDARTHASKRNYLIFPLTSTPTRHHLPISACYLLALSDQSIITEVPSYNQREATHADVDARARNSAGTATKCKQEEAFADPISVSMRSSLAPFVLGNRTPPFSALLLGGGEEHGVK